MRKAIDLTALVASPQTEIKASQDVTQPVPQVDAGKTVDLAAWLKNRPKLNRPVEEPVVSDPEGDALGEATPPVTPGEDVESSEPEKPTSKFEKFEKEKLPTLLKDFIIKPEKLATFGITMLNSFRQFALPWVYDKGFGFSAGDKEVIEAASIKRIEAEKENREPELSNHEKRLLRYYDELCTAKRKVAYTEDEIHEFAQVLAAEIGEVGVPKWIENHRLLCYFLFVEFMHSWSIVGFIGQKRVEDRFQ